MASAAEQLAANLNIGAFAKATDLQKRILFTVAALIVYRLGTYIPLPGIDPAALDQLFQRNAGGLLGTFDLLAGGALSRMTIFALNIMPYITASIIVQLMSPVSPKLDALRKEGEAGRKVLNQYTRYLTVIVATLQAYGLAVGLEHAQGGSLGSVVIDPGLMFRLTSVISIVGGTMFVMWLGEQITARGIGNGTSLIIFAGIVAGLPRAVAVLLDSASKGGIAPLLLIGIVVGMAAVIAFIVFMERAQRRIIVQYPKRQVGNRMFGGENSHLPLKLNTSGVIPPIFASSLLLIPATFAGIIGAAGSNTAWSQWIANNLRPGDFLHIILYVALMVFFAFFYTAIVFNPAETADNLKKHGGFIPGIRPGKNTADYLDYVLTRLTVIGAAYLAFVCILPEIFFTSFNVPFQAGSFGGTSLLIIVTVTMDTVAQIHSHLIAHQYEGLIKKSRLRGRN